MMSVNSWGMASTYGTSRAAPASDKFRTAQLNAARSNSMIAPLSTRRRIALRFSSMCPAFFWGPWGEFLQRLLVRAVNKLLKRHTVHAETRGRSKTIRVAATDSYKDHGATQWFHYTNNTDAIYEVMYGGTAAQLRKKWRLGPKANIRGHLTTEQLNTIIQIEGAITLQLEARQITNPADQLRVVRHVALSYRNLLEAPLPLTGQAWPLPSGIHPKKRPQRARAEAVGRLMCQGSPTRCHNPGSRGLFRAHPGVIIRLGSAGVCFLPTDTNCPVCSAGRGFRWPGP